MAILRPFPPGLGGVYLVAEGVEETLGGVGVWGREKMGLVGLEGEAGQEEETLVKDLFLRESGGEGKDCQKDHQSGAVAGDLEGEVDTKLAERMIPISTLNFALPITVSYILRGQPSLTLLDWFVKESRNHDQCRLQVRVTVLLLRQFGGTQKTKSKLAPYILFFHWLGHVHFFPLISLICTSPA